MMEFVLLTFMLFVSQLFFYLSFPLVLGGLVLILGVLIAIAMVAMGSSLFGFSFFMVLVGGVLVVFGYTVSLVSSSSMFYKSEIMASGKWLVFLLMIFFFFFFLWSYMIGCILVVWMFYIFHLSEVF